MLRKAGIASKKRVLDLGAGTGEVLPELNRRAQGMAVGLDADRAVLRLAGGMRVVGDAGALPFPDETFDLVFAQMFFLWAAPLEAAIEAVYRILVPGGHVIAAAEPDYGGTIVHPPEAGAGLHKFTDALRGEGADTEVGRKLGPLLERAGFRVECGVHPARPLEAGRPESVFAAPELCAPSDDLEFLFVPYFYFLGVKCRSQGPPAEPAA